MVNEETEEEKGLPLRPGNPVCASYFHTGSCISGPTCIFDHPSLIPVHKNTSFHLNQRGFSSSIGDSSSDLVEPATKQRSTQKNISAVASKTQHLNSLGFSYSTGESSSELVKASTKKPPIRKNTSSVVPKMTPFNPLGFSFSIVDSSRELVEASTTSETTHTNVGGNPSGSAKPMRIRKRLKETKLEMKEGELGEEISTDEESEYQYFTLL
ncbi:zinc finger CCCH domain-containing protein 37 [Brassica napus]|uniref:zinc finger CCCH domain-containing protein 37 n=1 Tax=Brassica napus TaxID=3708 RepID=UPI0020791724|nr:zinc finger CCCH domain-containing protein 37 [Brassica napus]